MTRLAAALLAILLSGTFAHAQAGVLRWEDGGCRSVLRYDPKKIDKRALEGTVAILRTDQEAVPIAPMISTPADAAEARPEAFERDCAATAARLRVQPLLPLDGLEAFRGERARQIDDACAFGSAGLRGYADPSRLRAYVPAAGHCDLYIDALEGKSDLTVAWRRTVKESCADNASPADCTRRSEAEANLPDGADRKRLHVLTYGWQNCATKHASFNGESGDRLQTVWQALYKRFKKAYRVKDTCERD